MDTAGYQGPQTPKRPKRKSAPPKRPESGEWACDALGIPSHGGFVGKNLGCLDSIMRLRDLIPEVELKTHHDSLRNDSKLILTASNS